MPSIFASKVFQNQYKEWSKELSANPHSLETNAVVKQLLADLQRPAPAESNSFKWRMRELKGKEILSEFTELFFETHKVTKTQAEILNRTLSEILPKDDLHFKKIYNQLIVNAEDPNLSENDRVREVQEKLNQRIDVLQNFTKNQKVTHKFNEKKASLWKKLAGACVAHQLALGIGVVATLAAAAAFPVLWIPLMVLVGVSVAFAFVGIAAIHKEEKHSVDPEKQKIIDNNVRKIDRLMHLHKLTNEKKFEEFINQIDQKAMNLILLNDENIEILLSRCAQNDYTLPFRTYGLNKFATK